MTRLHFGDLAGKQAEANRIADEAAHETRVRKAKAVLLFRNEPLPEVEAGILAYHHSISWQFPIEIWREANRRLRKERDEREQQD